MLIVSWLEIKTINGRSNVIVSKGLKDKGIKATPVAADAVDPVSSTSRVAFCTTLKKQREILLTTYLKFVRKSSADQKH